MLEVEAFHEPPRSLADPANDKNRSVPLISQQARHHTVLAAMATVLQEPPGPTEPPEAQDPGGS